MGIKTIILGRPDGFRARLRRALTGRGRDKKPAEPVVRAPAPVAAEAALGLHPEAPKDVTPPEGFEVVLHKDALKPGRITEIIIGGTAIAVANVGGDFFALSNSCPHADGPLGEGSLEGSVLTCPNHGWQFDLRDGSCLTASDVKLKTFAVRVVDTAVCVRI